MLQIRIADFDGGNPVILENAKNRVYSKAINSADEGVSFDISKNAPKAEVLNPDIDGYTKRWEVWDTNTNTRLNWGPISSIAENGPDWKVAGLGRSALLADFYKSDKTFYTPIETVLDNVRYENLAAEPRTIALVPDAKVTAEQTTVFGASVVIDEKYYALSKNTKDRAIDDDTGQFKPGEIEPPNTYFTTDTYWSGMSKSDTLIIDLGGVYPVHKINLSLPAWGGQQRLYNRAYTYRISFGLEGATELQGRTFGAFTTLYSTANPNRNTGGISFWVGYDSSNVLTTSSTYVYLQPIEAKYIRVEILDTHAWFGTHFDTEPSADAWEFQCDPDYVTGSIPSRGSQPAVMKDEISTRELQAANDCHASIKELGVETNIIGRDTIKDLALQRIDNNNLQIIYSHTPDASEIITTDDGFRKFEPGSLFRTVTFTYSGAGTAYTKFFDSDCTNCFPSGFNFGIMDQYSNLVYASHNSSNTTVTRTFGAYTKHILMKGASNATVDHVDAWPATLDQFSWGGSYSHTEVTGDTAILHFRGESLKWFATVPAGKTGASVSLDIRHKDSGGSWTAWTGLTSFTLPDNINNEIVYQIPYEDHYFIPDTVYQIRITNNGGFCSIDSFEGYWSASMVEYNEDSLRISVNKPENIKQIYDKRFSGGSMYKFFEPAFTGFSFTGDRVIVLSAKGRNHGQCRLLLRNLSISTEYDSGTAGHVFIPGGDPTDGSLRVDLDTGFEGNEITQYVLFDSNDYFPNGLPWARYAVNFYLHYSDQEEYTSDTADIEFDSFVKRCQSCDPPSGDFATVNKPVFLDSIIAHELVGLSVAFDIEQHLEILKSVTEVLQVEWDITDTGLRVEPRLGEDTDEFLREGQNTLVDWEIVNDISQMASILISNGADIDGLPLFTITENKETRTRLGRTVMRQQDFRNLADYMQLIGLSRTELRKRAYPTKRITVTHIAEDLHLEAGDSFMLWTKKMGTIRVRINRKQISESQSGRTYDLECIVWPQIS